MPRAPKGAERVEEIVMSTAQPLTIAEVASLANTSRPTAARRMKTLHDAGDLVGITLKGETGARMYRPANGRRRDPVSSTLTTVDVLEGNVGIGMCFRVVQIMMAPATGELFVNLDNGEGTQITARLNA